MKYQHRRLFLVTLLAVVAVGPWYGEAEAREFNQRVAIGAFRGPKAMAFQDAVEGALLRRYALVPEETVTEAARQLGVHLRSNDDFAEVARTLNVRAFVSATVTREPEWRVEMVVRRGDTGEIAARYDWSDSRIDGLAAALARATPKRLRALLAAEPQAPAAEPSAQMLVKAAADEEGVLAKPRRLHALQTSKPARREAEAEVRAKPAERRRAVDDDDDEVLKGDNDDDRDDEQDAPPVRPYLELGVGGRIFSRSMSFADNINRVPGYRLDRATAITVDVAFHPFALGDSTRKTWAAGLGLTGSAKYALGIGTELSGTDGRSRAEVHGYEVGLRYRAPIGIVDLIPHVDYAVETFIANVADLAPDVGYQLVRMGLATRIGISREISLRLHADYLHVMSAGPLTDPTRFPRATANGVDLSVGGGYGITNTLEVQASVGMRRYGFDMHARPGDTPLAGGAIDEYVFTTIGVAYRPALRSP